MTDPGWIHVANALKPCKCRWEKSANLKIPKPYWSSSIADFGEQRRDVIVEWIAYPGNGLLLTGAAGRGKTHLAAAIVRHLRLNQIPAAFYPAEKLYGEIRRCFGNGTESELAVLRNFTQPQYLALDDIGAGSLSDMERRYTLQVIEARINAMRPTIVTSNWSLAEIAEKLDERIASRLETFKRIEFKQGDRRKRRGL